MPPTSERTTGVGVFLKYPEPGRVKTRLAAGIGPERAASLYEKMVAHVLQRVIAPLPSSRYRCTLFYDPYRPLGDYAKWLGEKNLPFASQKGADLGERMASALDALLASHQDAILIGTDCLDLRDGHLRRAAEALSSGSDVVLGPAEDGGYYLIGTRSRQPALFEAMAWSTPEVLPETLSRCEAARLRVAQLPPLADIDTPEDLARYPWLLE